MSFLSTCTPLVISSRLRAFNTVTLLMTTKFVSPAQTSPLSSSFAHATPCLTLLDVLAYRNPKFNTFNTEFLIPQNAAPPPIFPISVNGNPVLPVSQAKTLAYSHFRLFFISHSTCNLSVNLFGSMCKIYSEPQLLSLPFHLGSATPGPYKRALLPFFVTLKSFLFKK